MNRTVVLQPAKRTPPNISRNRSSNTQRTEVRTISNSHKKYINKALNTKQPMKNTTHKRTQWSQSIIDSGQNQLKYTYQLQQGDKTHHTKHTTTHRKVTLIAKTSVFTEQDDRCGNLSTQSQAPEDGHINVRNMLST